MEDNQLLEAVKSGETDFKNIKRDYTFVLPVIVKSFEQGTEAPSKILAYLSSEKSGLAIVAGSYQPLISYVKEISEHHGACCDAILSSRIYRSDGWKDVLAYCRETAFPHVCRLKIKTVLLKHLNKSLKS
jgi:hypothetical protein